VPAERPQAIVRTDDTIVLRAVARELARIDDHLRAIDVRARPALALVDPDWTESAQNLVHYAALRQLDLRELQLLLQQHGLSSLGRSESCVLRSLLEVRQRLAEALLVRGAAVASEVTKVAQRRAAALSWRTAEFLLHAHTHDVFGPKPEGRHVYVMVTASSAAEVDRPWLTTMLRAGMNVLRINCSHEGPAEWNRIVDALARARRDVGAECRILMDLGGPKIRTGPIAEDVRVITWKPERDRLGRVIGPARIMLRPQTPSAAVAAGPCLVVDRRWFARLRAGDVLHFRDTRRKARTLTVRGVTGTEVVAEATARAYVLDGTAVEHRRGRRLVHRGAVTIGGPSDAAITLASGDPLVLTPRAVVGRGATAGARGRPARPAVVSCTLPDALAHVGLGHRLLFDDGKIETVVERLAGRDVHLRVTRTSKPRVKLRAEKGINLPDSGLSVGSMTPVDREHLAFVAEHADLVGLSFVRRPEDVRALHQALDAIAGRRIGIVLKIETKAGFEALPRILLEAMHRPPVAVMIARGDLAVELGFERLAEVQEEILWLCEASHVPAVWATQVLDSLARTGVPSRAEVTDAAASVAAECVMLNKGPHVAEAVRALVDIVRRMERHRYKKRSIFRKLRVSALWDAAPADAPVRR
jgi:pyruvate kinase